MIKPYFGSRPDKDNDAVAGEEGPGVVLLLREVVLDRTKKTLVVLDSDVTLRMGGLHRRILPAYYVDPL